MKLKKKLTRNGIQYFDAGGNVVGGNTTQNSGASLNQGLTTGSTPFVTLNPATAVNAAGQIAQGAAGAFTAQNGYQAQLAPTTLSNYQPVIGSASGNALNGYGQFNENLQAQQQLRQALLNQSNGVGPNPALTQLNQTTGQNIAAEGALAAGQRGASSNVGLIARQAAQQGGNIQQQAAGQAATLAAQQQLAAESAAAGLTGNIGQEITNEQNANTGLFTGAAGAQNTQNTGEIQNYGMAQGINAGVAAQNANATNSTLGGVLGGAGALAALFNKGGQVGGKNTPTKRILPPHLKGIAEIYHPQKLASGGSVIPSYLKSPYVPDFTSGTSGNAGTGLASAAGSLLAEGGSVPGKAKVKGDSPKNDVALTMLSPKEIVLPRSVTMAPDAPERAKEFVARLQKKYQGDHEDFRNALKKAMANRRAA